MRRRKAAKWFSQELWVTVGARGLDGHLKGLGIRRTASQVLTQQECLIRSIWADGCPEREPTEPTQFMQTQLSSPLKVSSPESELKIWQMPHGRRNQASCRRLNRRKLDASWDKATWATQSTKLLASRTTAAVTSRLCPRENPHLKTATWKASHWFQTQFKKRIKTSHFTCRRSERL